MHVGKLYVHAFVLTPGLTWSIHGDLYGSVVSGHLWWVGEYCDCQREALACGDIKQHQMTCHLQRQWPAFIAKPSLSHKCGCDHIIANTNWEKSTLRGLTADNMFEGVYLGSLAQSKWKIDWRSQYLVIQNFSLSNAVWVGERHFNSHFLSQ